MPRPKGRPNQGKTETIRARTVKVYLPSEELVNDWKSAAKESDLSLSQYILETVERQRAHGTGPYLPKLELEKSLGETQEELSQLKSKHEILEAAYQKRDQDAKHLSDLLKKQKTAPDNLGMVRKMIEMFKTWPEDDIDIEEVVDKLGIDYKDEHNMAQLRESATFLRSMGLLKSHFYGWEWMGEKKNFTQEEEDS